MCLSDNERVNHQAMNYTPGDLALTHNELLLDAISLLPDTIINTWKFYFVGPSTKEFELYLKDFINNNPKLKNSIVLTGKITNSNFAHLNPS